MAVGKPSPRARAIPADSRLAPRRRAPGRPRAPLGASTDGTRAMTTNGGRMRGRGYDQRVEENQREEKTSAWTSAWEEPAGRKKPARVDWDYRERKNPSPPALVLVLFSLPGWCLFPCRGSSCPVLVGGSCGSAWGLLVVSPALGRWVGRSRRVGTGAPRGWSGPRGRASWCWWLGR